jgi:hypothetical protein
MAKLKDSLTILYYSSSHEKPEFERKIIENLQEACGDLPIVSVSQKPLDLGKNICVGDVGLSYLNEWRQMFIGAKEVQTPYIVFAESDHLYPKEYFSFVPPRAGSWHYDNVWTVFKDVTRAGSYRRKEFSDGAQICDKKSLVERLERFLADKPQWGEEYYDEQLLDVPFDYFSGPTACIVFKTGDGVSNSANVINKPGNNRKNSLPYWGHVTNLRAKYFG